MHHHLLKMHDLHQLQDSFSDKITGYIRGGCTAIGMKKDYPTVLDESANAQEKIIVSGGKNGIQIELTTEDYLKACKGKTADITLR